MSTLPLAAQAAGLADTGGQMAGPIGIAAAVVVVVGIVIFAIVRMRGKRG